MIRYDELLFKRFNEDWSKLPVSKMLSLLNVKKQTTLPTVVNSDLLNKKLNIKFEETNLATCLDFHSLDNIKINSPEPIYQRILEK